MTSDYRGLVAMYLFAFVLSHSFRYPRIRLGSPLFLNLVNEGLFKSHPCFVTIQLPSYQLLVLLTTQSLRNCLRISDRQSAHRYFHPFIHEEVEPSNSTDVVK